MYNIYEKIVLVGGGGGVSVLVRHLRNIRKDIVTIHTVFDSGGHTGLLRKEYDTIGLGDIRRSIAAQANEFLPWAGLMEQTFSDGTKLGNLMLLGAMKSARTEMAGIDMVCQMMGVPNKILPISLDRAKLCAWMSDNVFHEGGESELDTRSLEDPREIDHIYLSPPANLFVLAHEAIVGADKIVFPPGDPYTSILPNTRVRGFQEAIAESKAKIGMVINLFTKKAESPNWSASRFVKTLLRAIGRDNLDFVVCNTGTIPADILCRYTQMCSFPVLIDEDELSNLAETVICDNFVNIQFDQNRQVETVRHNAATAAAIANI